MCVYLDKWKNIGTFADRLLSDTRHTGILPCLQGASCNTILLFKVGLYELLSLITYTKGVFINPIAPHCKNITFYKRDKET